MLASTQPDWTWLSEGAMEKKGFLIKAQDQRYGKALHPVRFA
jgi:hypothetical protein